MLALDAIIEWSQKELPGWQRDAVRRILTQEELTDDDKAELLLMLKKKYGLIESDQTVPEPEFLKRGDISGSDSSQSQKIVLKAMNNLHGVNAICDGACLPFAHEGMTVIYGENASGKSGYARVIKKACRARDINERILPNVYSNDEPLPAKSTFKLALDDQPDDIEVEWQDGLKDLSLLSNISVFDSKCARVIVDENNEASYLPYGAHVFEKLVSLIKEFRQTLAKEKLTPRKLEYDDIKEATEAGKILKQLSHDTPESIIEDFAKWDEEKDEKKLIKLKKAINKAEAEDPIKQAKRIENLKDRITEFINNISKVDSKFSESKVDEIKNNLTGLKAAQKAINAASDDQFSSEPLKGVGETAWKLLYNAAKEFSTKHSYPGKEFPVTEDGGLCVLCMQPLETEAKDRMIRFKNFMEENIQLQAEQFNKLIDESIEECNNINVPSTDSYKDVLDEIGSREEGLLEKIIEYLSMAENRLKDLIKNLKQKIIEDLTPLIMFPKNELKLIIEMMEKEIAELKKTADPEILRNLKQQREELEARKLFYNRKDKILEYLKALKQEKKYDDCINQIDFRRITLRGKEIITGALTPQLRRSLQEELIALNANHIPLNLKASGAGGETKHQMQIIAEQPLKKINLSDILSEGEQRVVAIAGFLAELQTGGHCHPIVFDDPVCSLDHKYRERIAGRLAKESKIRQLIIFTHDIAFLLDLKSKAGEDDGTCLHTQTIKKGYAGECIEGLPWHAMSLKKRLKLLNTKLDTIHNLYNENLPEYNNKAANIYGLLRESWECFVEEVLLLNTIQRHGNEVQTQRLKSITVTTDDYKKIHIGMGKCSKWLVGHSKSKTIDVNQPPPGELREDIKSLKTFAGEINARNNNLRKEREGSLEPEKAAIG